MFHTISNAVAHTMRELEVRDARDRQDGTQRLDRLRQITPETGRFLAILAASTPSGAWIEIGSSAGYSSLWLSLACRERDCVLTTYEVLAAKAALARATFAATSVDDTIHLVEGDFLEHFSASEQVSFCFLDAEKEIYQACYDRVVPQLVPGGLLVADNAISHREELQPLLDVALRDSRVDAVVVPIGKGELVCRKR